MKQTGLTFAILALLLSAHAAVGTDLRLTVSFPPRLVDGDPLVAFVTLTNTSKTTLHVTEMQPLRNLHPSIRRLEVYPSGKCVAQEHFTPAMSERHVVTLAPGDSATAQVDIAAEYPFGLEPGRYELTVIFSDAMKMTSSPMTFEVSAPTAGARAASYREFTKVCSALKSRKEGAAASALAFAERNRTFAYSRALLNYARIDATGETRLAIDELLVRTYPESREAQAARADRERLTQREASLKAYRSYLTQYAQELRRPENADAARELQQLPSITRPDDFMKYESFLSRYPRSFFADDVLHRMIVAVDEGILPPGYSNAEADRVRRDLSERLGTVNGYWAQKAKSAM